MFHNPLNLLSINKECRHHRSSSSSCMNIQTKEDSGPKNRTCIGSRTTQKSTRKGRSSRRGHREKHRIRTVHPWGQTDLILGETTGINSNGEIPEKEVYVSTRLHDPNSRSCIVKDLYVKLGIFVGYDKHKSYV